MLLLLRLAGQLATMFEHVATAATWSTHELSQVAGRRHLLLLWVILVPAAILRHIDHSLLLLPQLVNKLLVHSIAVSIARLVPAHTTQLLT